jgi:hypothetical protein
MSETGWSNADVFRDYLQNHFIPNVRRGEKDDQPILLILDGHATHISKQVIEWAVSQHLILFVLPAHSSHVLQPLDVAVFGPFKGYYYRECAAFMRQNMGKAVTKYSMTEIACKAYLHAMTPANIISAFKKTGIHPLNKEAINSTKLFPSEVFRDNTPLQKIAALKSGKESVDKYLQMKAEGTADAPFKECGCRCTCQGAEPTRIKKPKASGREITTPEYLEAISVYIQEKENKQPNKNRNTSSKPTAAKKLITSPELSSPKPSTSGLNQKDAASPMLTDNEESDDESGVCCVCNQFSPPNLHTRPYLKLVNWGYCDKCSHCVHLQFCHEKHVLRRHDTFLCPHCV